MDVWREELVGRAGQFADPHSVQIIGQLGYGYDGTVFATSRQSAMKVLRFERLFLRELSVYLRLQEHDVTEIHGFAVPQLITASDDLLAIEIGIVSPPFVLDFAGAYLDRAPDYPAEVIEEWEADKREQFGEERWEMVRILMFAFHCQTPS
ncbi:MAG: hypothetical protein RIK87_21495 [Fuerstiella sp.]